MGNASSMPKITNRDRAILDLKIQRDKIRQYQLKIQTVLDREQEAAKEFVRKGQKDRALLALRRRKYQESLLLKTDSQLQNLEEVVSTIEFSLVEMSVLHGLQQGNKVLEEIHKEMSIESVEKLLAETAEAREYQQEISDMLANSMTIEEEEAVVEQLARMESEALGLNVPHLPNAPVNELPVHVRDPATVAAETEEEPERVAIPS